MIIKDKMSNAKNSITTILPYLQLRLIACRNVCFSCRTWLGSDKLSYRVGLTGYQVGVGNT